MAYSDFSLADLKAKFQIVVAEDARLFDHVAPVEPPPALGSLLAENIPLALAIDTEKARSEFIIAPILAECRRALRGKVSLFSGVDFPVDPAQGLNGLCDFIISRSPEQFYVSVPVVVLVEAKNNRIKEGIPQCIAEMIAAHLFNERQGNQPPAVYGVVTTGSLWRFLQLEGGTVAIDREEYHIRDVKTIWGILLFITGGG